MNTRTSPGEGAPPCGAPRRHLTRAIARATALALAVLPLALTTSPASAATTYLVSQGDAACSDAGAGNAAAPFCSITAATKKAVPGDVISVRAGDYHEQVNPGSGVTVTADSGASVSGTDDLSSASWSAESAPTTFSAVLGPLALPTVASARGAALTKASSVSAMTAGSWYYAFAARKLYVDLGANQAPGASDRVEVGRSYGVNVSAGPATVDGLDVRAAHVAGILVRNVTGSRITRLSVSGSRGYGILVSGGSDSSISQVRVTNNASVGVRLTDATNTSVLDSEADHNSNHGVSVAGGSGNVVAGVVSHENVSPAGSPRVATGIDVTKSAQGPSFDALVERNTTYRNADSGIEIYQGSARALVRRNLSYDNGDHGIDISFSPSARVVSNTVVGNATPGINVEGGSTGVSVRDNIAMNNAIGATGTQGDIRVDAQSVSGTTLDRDLVYQSTGTPTVIEWAGADYSTMAAFRAAQPTQERRGIQADPKFVALASRGLGLTIGSPGVDAADADADGWTDTDRQGNAPVDQPTVTNSGRGTPGYADLGALELAQSAPQDATPVAALSASPSNAQVGQTVTLDASGSTDDQGIATYTFDCGNGVTTAPQSSPTTTCVYGAAGTFTAAAAVQDAAGQSDRATASISATASPGPHAVLDVSRRAVRQLEPVTLDANRSSAAAGTQIVAYWFSCNVGRSDPVTQPGAAFTCTYRKTGPHRVGVAVIDDQGASEVVHVVVRVKRGDVPHARFTLSTRHPRTGQGVVVATGRSTSSLTSTIVQVTVKCGNGHKVHLSRPGRAVCRYSRPGRYVVRVRVEDGRGLSDSTTRAVRVRAR